MEALDRLHAVRAVGALAEDQEVVITSGDGEFGPLEAWLAMLTLLCCVLVMVATLGACKCRQLLTYWDQDGSTLVRHYLQKMCVYNLLVLGILYMLYTLIYTHDDVGQPEQCLKLGEHKLLALMVIVGSIIVGLVRFLANGFAHSESYNFAGSSFDNLYPENAHRGFSAHQNPIYRNMINPYLKVSGLVLVLVLLYLYAPLPAGYTEPILNSAFCLSGWPPEEDTVHAIWRLLPIILLLFLPVLVIILIEHVSHVVKHGFYTKTPGYISVLNAPFIMVTLTTTWSLWLGLLVVVWWCFGLGAGEYFSMLTLFYTCCDSFMLLFATVVVGRKNR